MMKDNSLLSQPEILKEVFDHSDVTVLITSESGELLYKNRDSVDLLFGSNPSSLPSAAGKKPFDRHFVFRNTASNVKLIETEQGSYYLYLFADDAEKKQLLNENLALRDIIDHVDNGVILSDKDGYIRLYNKAHQEIDGYTKEYVIGKHLSELYRVENHTRVQAEKKAIDMRFHYYATMEREHIPLVTGTYPYIDPETDEVFGVYSIERDISAIRKLQQKVANMEQQLSRKTRKNNTRFTFDDILGSSAIMQDAIACARRFANSSAPVMIYGETGTGKELFAQSIHNASLRADSPFIAVNCGAVPENLIESTLFGSVKGAFTGAENQKGLFAEAKDGTLFLDEVNSMSYAMQTKLLRVLQEKKVRPVGSSKEYPVQCRVLSSCNADPEEALREKTFRRDLYYRLAVVRLDVPPLNRRGDDVAELADHFAKKYAVAYRKHFTGFDPEFRQFLFQYEWDGNVRELEFTIEGCIALLDDVDTAIQLKHLPANLLSKAVSMNISRRSHPADNLPTMLAEYEKTIILNALEDNGGNISRTAAQLGILRQNLQHRMKKLNITK